jgi:hypothetical protein
MTGIGGDLLHPDALLSHADIVSRKDGSRSVACTGAENEWAGAM